MENLIQNSQTINLLIDTETLCSIDSRNKFDGPGEDTETETSSMTLTTTFTWDFAFG